jgi:glycosyltransferase involved in cell wall biosynthesis
MNLPKISIITPSYNQGNYIEETILSVINQGYPNLEYIVIDGGSSDQSVDIIKKYEKELTYWVSEKDKGQSEAINKGLRKATGEIVTWVNSDDLLFPGVLNKLPNRFSDPEVGLVYGHNVAFGDGITGSKSNLVSYDELPRYLGSVAFPQPASFFKREVLLKHGYLDEGLHYGMDYDFFVRIALNYKIKSFPELVSKYRFHPESKSVAHSFKFARDWAIVFSKLLRSSTEGLALIPVLEKLDLYVPGNDKYMVSVSISEGEILKALIYFLNEQAQCYYGSLQLEKARDIASAVKQLDISLYKKLNLNQIYWRSKMLNSGLINSLRKIKCHTFRL